MGDGVDVMGNGSEPRTKRPALDGLRDDLVAKGADHAIEAGLKGWWKQRTEIEKVATGLIASGVAIGPLGLGLLGAVAALYKDAIPSTEQIKAVWWLLLITAPLAAFVIVAIWITGRFGPIPVGLGAAAVAAVLASSAMSHSVIPTKLAGLYCAAEISGNGVVYQDECEKFDYAGFVGENASRAGPSGAVNVLSSAVAYTVDARGSIMAFAALLVSGGLGLLLREHV
jgi:hypothetical protein